MAATKGVRRIVTTHDAAGTAVVGFDAVTPVSGGEPQLRVEGYLLWVTDETPADISKKGRTSRRSSRSIRAEPMVSSAGSATNFRAV